MPLEYQTTDAARSLDEQQLLDWLQGWHVVDPAGGSNEVTVGTGDFEYDVAGGDVNLGGSITTTTSGSIAFGTDVDPNDAKIAVIYRDSNGDVQKKVGDKGSRDPEGLNVRQTPVPPAPSMYDVDGTVLAEVLIPAGVSELTTDHFRDRRLPANLNAATIVAMTTLTAPTKASPSQTGEGELVWDSDDDKLTVGDGSARKTMVNEERIIAGGNGIESMGNLSQNRTVNIAAGGVGLNELSNPFGLDELTDMDVDSTDLTDGATVLYESANGWFVNEVVQALRNFTSDEVFASYPLPIGDLNNPFGLDELTDMDVDGTDLTDGATVLYESSNSWFRNEVVQALANFTGDEQFSQYPLALADLDSPFGLDAITDMDAGQTPLTNLPAPTADNHAARKAYVDAVEQALDIKDSVVAATDGSIVDLTSASDPNPIDGVTLADGERVLLKDQTTGSENGIYDAVTATDPTTWTRSEDADEDADVTAGLYTFVEEGTNNSDRGFVLTTNDPITVGTTALAFTQFSGAGQITAGDGLSKTGDTLAVVVADFAGAGLEDDGSADLRIAAAAAGDGLKGGGGSALAIEPADFAGTGLEDDGSDDLQIANGRGVWARTDVTSTTYTASAWESLWVDTATAGAAVTVTLPPDSGLQDGDRVEVGVSDAANNTDVAANTGQSIISPNPTLTQTGDSMTFEYKASNSTWLVR